MTDLGVCIYQGYLPPDPSGAGKQAVTLARRLRQEGVDVFLVGDRPDQDVGDSLETVPVYWVRPLPESRTWPQLIAYCARVGWLLFRLRKRFDVLHLHGETVVATALIPGAKLLGKSVVVRTTLGGSLSRLTESLRGHRQRLLLLWADRYVALSRQLATEMEEGGGLPPGRIERIPNGIDETVYHPVSSEVKEALRRELGLPRDRRILVFHGVFMARKSLRWLVDNVGPQLAEADLHLLLVGMPARDEAATGYAAALEKQATRGPFADRVEIRSYTPAIDRYLKASDLYVLPSTGEGLSNALLEAMAVGLVPIATRTSGTEDVVEDGINGALFEPRDAESFFRAFHACVDVGEDRRQELSAAAVETIRRSYTIEATARRYIEVYRKALDGSV